MDSNNNDATYIYSPMRRSSAASVGSMASGFHISPQRRSSVASAKSTASSVSPEERRKQIQAIMNDSGLSQKEKRKSIQALMDGRAHRSSDNSIVSVGANSRDGSVASYVNSISQAAAAAAAFYAKECEGLDASATEVGMSPGDDSSVASSVTSHSKRVLDRDFCQVIERQNPAGLTYRAIRGRSQSLMEWRDGAERVTAAANATFCNPVALSKLMEQSRPSCEHYIRNCTLVSPCCGLAFGCRICHDECPELPPPIATRRSSITNDPGHLSTLERRRSLPPDFQEEEDTHHRIDRFAIKEIICRTCFTRQSSKTNNCLQCGIQFGDYHCSICNLWMADTESPYHCHECGFCRVGGRENFHHCNDCGMCIDASLFNDHNCKSGKYMSNCPICQEDLFSSRFASHEMPCGHAIHWHCFKDLITYDSRCPVCKKTAESPEQMSAAWSTIAMGIALQPVPPEMARVVNILCIDCEEKDNNRRWHFLGVPCNRCFSFNTTVEQIVKQGKAAADFLRGLDEQETIPSNISLPSWTGYLGTVINSSSSVDDSESEMDLSPNSDDMTD